VREQPSPNKTEICCRRDLPPRRASRCQAESWWRWDPNAGGQTQKWLQTFVTNPEEGVGPTCTRSRDRRSQDPAYTPLDPVRLYEPSTKPGHPLPPAWVEREGERIALGSLVHDGHFLLIAGEDGDDWVGAAREIAEEQALPIRAATVGVLGSDYVDVRCSWLKHRGISRSGAVLVRPDRYIAYRSVERVADPLSALRRVFGQILGRQQSLGEIASA
jgi:hypothetical protein